MTVHISIPTHYKQALLCKLYCPDFSLLSQISHSLLYCQPLFKKCAPILIKKERCFFSLQILNSFLFKFHSMAGPYMQIQLIVNQICPLPTYIPSSSSPEALLSSASDQSTASVGIRLVLYNSNYVISIFTEKPKVIF